ncbi:MAG TPA: Abi family protein, partial [bacterium]|nr:Abi family protein [bacterium]
YHIAHNEGPFSYSEKRIFPRLNVDFDKWIASISDEYDRNQELFKNHFKLKYGDSHSLPPIWISVEIMSFGDVVRIFRSYDSSLSKEFARETKIPDKVLESWFLSLNYIRNICAHHSRLWNKMLSVKPLLPNSRKYKQWDIVDRYSQSHIFVIIAICSCFLKTIAPKSSWKNRIFDLLKEYPEVDIKEMGFPYGWKEFLEQI